MAYETRNRVTNIGSEPWSKDTGLLSIWLLGMYKHGPKTTVVIPFRQGDAARLGNIVNDEYFGKVPADRLKVADGVLFFSGDGRYRSKIGLSPRRATSRCGSYDAERGVLTCVAYNQPAAGETDYVNSMWEIQQEPFAGDAINSYNDGPPSPGAKPLGPFYELETSSPALALQPGQTAEHVQVTCHWEGAPRAWIPWRNDCTTFLCGKFRTLSGKSRVGIFPQPLVRNDCPAPMAAWRTRHSAGVGRSPSLFQRGSRAVRPGEGGLTRRALRVPCGSSEKILLRRAVPAFDS